MAFPMRSLESVSGLHQSPFKFDIPPVEPLSIWDWIFLIFMLLFSLTAIIMGGYFTYMNEHGHTILFKAICEQGFTEEDGKNKKKKKDDTSLRELVTELSRAESETAIAKFATSGTDITSQSTVAGPSTLTATKSCSSLV